MDNLTHSLIGAALGQAGLKRKTGLAMPALIIAANLPDIDVACFLWLDGLEHLAFRRGITHGPIALLVLPLMLAGGLRWFDRWQARRGTRPEGRAPVRFGWLLALCYIGCLTHPLFDWFNNYGIRLLEPFSHRWFYGDTLFIIDPWIIAMLGVGVWLSLRRERRAESDWPSPARAAIVVMSAFIALNFLVSFWSRERGEVWAGHPYLTVANVPPVAFWERDVLFYGDRVWGLRHYYHISCGAVGCEAATERPNFIKETNISDPRIAAWSRHDSQARAFLFWSRMPIAELHPDRIVLRDQRFMDPRVANQFTVTLRPPKP